MHLENLHPKTLIGIKTLARDLKVHGGFGHAESLNRASGQSGYANYTAARRSLSREGPAVPPIFPIFVSIWWRDPTSGASGRETLRMEAGRPLDELVSLRTKRYARYLRGLKREGPDHLVYREFNASQFQARLHAAGAVRTLAFIEGTGLQPSGVGRQENPKGNSSNKLPGKDHPTLWFDPQHNQYIVTDEPYASRAEDPELQEKRAAWAQQWKMDLQSVNWVGIYYPDGGSRLFVYTDATRGYDLSRLIARIEALPPAVRSDEWSGQSARYVEAFVTPGTLTERALKQAAKPQVEKVPTNRGAQNSITYYGILGHRKSRPSGCMSIPDHVWTGQLIKAFMVNAEGFGRAQDTIHRVCLTLEDWMAEEYPHVYQLDKQTIVDAYLTDLEMDSLVAGPGEGAATALHQLGQAKAIVVERYPDCAALRALVAKMEKAVAFIDSRVQSVLGQVGSVTVMEGQVQ